jgi:hypothetical protein
MKPSIKPPKMSKGKCTPDMTRETPINKAKKIKT